METGFFLLKTAVKPVTLEAQSSKKIKYKACDQALKETVWDR